MAEIVERERTLRVARAMDVIVAGGGIAGVAAALASARTGARTLLLEKEGALGGLATLGLVIMYLPLCDGYGHQVIGGVSEELLRKSVALGNLPMHEPWRHVPACWNGEGTPEERAKTRYRVDFDAAPMMLTLEQLLLDAGVELWYDTRLCAAVTHDGSVSHVIVENKSGRLALAAKAFVDASGDADLCYLAGEDTISSAENRRSGWHFTVSDAGDVRLHALTDPLYAPCPEGSRFYAGDNGADVSAYLQDMRKMICAHDAGGAIPFLIPTIPLFRMTRRLSGRETLTTDDLGQWREDAVAMTGDWRAPAPVYTIGLAHLQGRHTNLFAAGRCISSSGDTWDVTRVIPTCGATGQAAGTAAAMLARDGKLGLNALQGKLRADGMILDPALTR